jgi:thiol-disulfide isomerase/thioredoxin
MSVERRGALNQSAPAVVGASPALARTAHVLGRAANLVAALAAVSLILVGGRAWATTGEERAAAAGRGLVGSLAPPLVIKTIDGQTIDLGKVYGKQAVYLKFWATWCVPCRQQMPHLEETFQTAGPSLAVIAINAGFNDTLADVKAYRQTVGLTMPIVIDDGRLGAAFNLRVTPQHIVIGRDGRILYVGHLADERLDAALRAAQAAPGSASAAGSTQAPHASLASQPRYAVGDTLPDLTLRMLDGTTVHTRDPADGRPTVLVFISPWCESYLAESRPQRAKSCRGVREQADTLARDTSVRWIGIASGLWATQQDLSDYRKEHQIAVPLTLDESGDLFRLFRVVSVPSLLVVDAHGRIVRRTEEVDPDLGRELQAMAKR